MDIIFSVAGGLYDSDFGKLIEAYKALGAKAVGEVTGNLHFDGPLYDNMLAQCAEHDIPVTIHISPELNWSYGVVDEPGLFRLEGDPVRFHHARHRGDARQVPQVRRPYGQAHRSEQEHRQAVHLLLL